MTVKLIGGEQKCWYFCQKFGFRLYLLKVTENLHFEVAVTFLITLSRVSFKQELQFVRVIPSRHRT